MSKVLIVQFKSNTRDLEVYQTLPAFLDRYPVYKEHSIEYYLSRLKVPYETDAIKISRVEVFKREK